jgi:hypothetical protein
VRHFFFNNRGFDTIQTGFACQARCRNQVLSPGHVIVLLLSRLLAVAFALFRAEAFAANALDESEQVVFYRKPDTYEGRDRGPGSPTSPHTPTVGIAPSVRIVAASH